MNRAPLLWGALFCGPIGGALMGGVAYTHSFAWAHAPLADQIGIMTYATVEGAFLVGFMGWGVAAGRMSPATLVGTLFALFFAMIGPGCDDYGGVGALVMAPVGALIGWLGFRHRGRDA